MNTQPCLTVGQTELSFSVGLCVVVYCWAGLDRSPPGSLGTGSVPRGAQSYSPEPPQVIKLGIGGVRLRDRGVNYSEHRVWAEPALPSP